MELAAGVLVELVLYHQAQPLDQTELMALVVVAVVLEGHGPPIKHLVAATAATA